MPMKREKYPKNWGAIALRVKKRARWTCQVCGKKCRQPGEPFDTHRRTLTVAHLNHDESDCREENLKAMCAPCHLRYDSRTKACARLGKPKIPDIETDLARAKAGSETEMMGRKI